MGACACVSTRLSDCLTHNLINCCSHECCRAVIATRALNPEMTCFAFFRPTYYKIKLKNRIINYRHDELNVRDFLTGNPTPEEEEARRISEMGKPILGEHSRLEVVIEESCEFKVCEWLIGSVTLAEN